MAFVKLVRLNSDGAQTELFVHADFDARDRPGLVLHSSFDGINRYVYLNDDQLEDLITTLEYVRMERANRAKNDEKKFSKIKAADQNESEEWEPATY